MNPLRSTFSPSSLFLVLAGSATDAIMILAFNVLTAAQTGNTILFAVAIARGDAVTGLSSAISVASFLAGALGGGWICRQERPLAALILQMGLNGAALGLWLSDAQPDATAANILVALAATSMGLQSAVTIHLHGQPGTYITGLLTNFASSLSAPRAASTISPPIQGFVWLLYLAGAIISGVVFLAVGPLALLIPMAAIAAACVQISLSRQKSPA